MRDRILRDEDFATRMIGYLESVCQGEFACGNEMAVKSSIEVQSGKIQCSLEDANAGSNSASMSHCIPADYYDPTKQPIQVGGCFGLGGIVTPCLTIYLPFVVCILSSAIARRPVINSVAQM